MKKAEEMEACRIVCIRAASKLSFKRQAVLFNTSERTVCDIHNRKSRYGFEYKRSKVTTSDVKIMRIMEGIKKEFLAISAQLTREKQAEVEGVCVNTIERLHKKNRDKLDKQGYKV